MLQRGSEVVKKFVGEYRSAFTEAENTMNDMIAEGDKVMHRWTLTATHSGEFRGAAPTGERFTVRGVGIFRFEGGKVVESWDVIDQLDMLRKLGEFRRRRYLIDGPTVGCGPCPARLALFWSTSPDRPAATRNP